MHRKSILYITDGLDINETLRRVTAKLDVAVSSVGLGSYATAIGNGHFDLVIADVGRDILRELPRMEGTLFEDGPIALLVALPANALADLRLPVRVPSDFIVKGASDDEYVARLRQLLWPGEEATDSEFIRIDNMTVNLATYQVQISGKPVDLTYLEYALFAFLITHPGRTYSRDALLRRVWGFEYYGGSRTVDVHVRRIRAKIGPELSQRLETVRGVGYLWNM